MIMNQKLTDLSGLRQVVTEYSLGVWVNDDVLHLTLLSSRFNRWKWVDYLFVEGLENKQSSELQHKVRNFLKKNRVWLLKFTPPQTSIQQEGGGRGVLKMGGNDRGRVNCFINSQ